MIPVITHFMQDIHEQEQTAGNTDCQTGDVDETVGFILHNAAQGYFQKVFKHKDISIRIMITS
jgi:hypothetical protein